uniref:Diacylglycerol lipase, beta n=1 Tax=Cyprinus carpio TaxID=7962 RepID=A0A8C2JT50_CYPCA
MPGMVVLGRRWRIASDDLVFPGAFELFIRAVWWIVTLVLYTNHKGRFDCQGGANLHNYLVVLLVLLAVIISTLCAVVYFSAQGERADRCCGFLTSGAGQSGLHSPVSAPAVEAITWSTTWSEESTWDATSAPSSRAQACSTETSSTSAFITRSASP